MTNQADGYWWSSEVHVQDGIYRSRPLFLTFGADSEYDDAGDARCEARRGRRV